MVNSSPKPSLIVSSQNLGWESIIVEEFEQPSGTIASGCWQEHTIILSLTTCSGRIWQANERHGYTGLYTKGDLTVIPAELLGYYQPDNDDRYLQIRIPPNLLQQVAMNTTSTALEPLELRTELRDRHPQIEQLAMMLRAELHRGKDGEGQLYVDSLANALMVNVLRGYSVAKSQVAIYEGGLSDRYLLKAIEYINHHLSQSIKLEDLSNHVGISKFHFSRLFKKSMGVTPYQYVMQQRIELAKQLLLKANMSISDVALECGFYSHAHLSKYFRNYAGMTPKAYRQS
ncbi:helix-turn-helix transcriptional regulator [Pleurocapsales cyanobacterium LEGE 10410]|nr:helix-turn-helix transcriptional regulator [Pleurocapsales cyanobacterium LEGE 10410]